MRPFRDTHLRTAFAALALAIGLVGYDRAVSPANAQALAPDFRLESTSGITRTRASYAGRVALLMYEDRDSGEVNAALKNEVKARIAREKLGGALVVVPIADVRSYDYWPARSFVRRAVVEKAKSLGVEILLDWTGDVYRAFHFRAPGSNVALVDRGGALAYFWQGPLPAAERQRFHEVLGRVLARKPAASTTAPALRPAGLTP